MRPLKNVAFGILLVLSATVPFILKAQAQKEGQQTFDAQAHEYWIDPQTGLMWTAKDNGKNVSWRQAIKYCRNLRIAEFTDWRLATIDELEGIYSGSAIDAPPPREGIQWALTSKPKGNLYLTGNHHWSSTKGLDDLGRPNGYAYYFDFSHGKRDWDPYGYHGSKRALCVRRPSKEDKP